MCGCCVYLCLMCACSICGVALKACASLNHPSPARRQASELMWLLEDLTATVATEEGGIAADEVVLPLSPAGKTTSTA